MTADEYQVKAARTINLDLSNTDIELHALFGMASEMGEVHSIYQKYYQGHDRDKEHVRKELGDLLWFIAELCTINGWQLSDVMATNIYKLESRYPNGFEPKRSLHREEGDI